MPSLKRASSQDPTPPYPSPLKLTALLPLTNQVPQSYVKEIAEITGEMAVPAVDHLRSSSAPAARGGTPLYYPLTSSSVPPNR